MAQYDPLRDYLSEYKGNELMLTFKQIDNIIAPKALPPSAYYPSSFWGNSTRRPKNKHVQAFAWYDAGWKVSKVDLQRQIVTFYRHFRQMRSADEIKGRLAHWRSVLAGIVKGDETKKTIKHIIEELEWALGERG